MQAPAPTELRYRKESRELVIAYGDERHTLGAEFLRVHSPSAEVQGHGGDGGTLPVGKESVAITGIEPVGNYAVKIRFSDGHDTGLYSWDWLRDLCRNRDALWQAYQAKAAALPAKPQPNAEISVVRFTPGK
ncbi:MAG: 1-(5-phosphoribosyl)-5-((5-phosphoribosylamino)methylideneamino)imidazole-4-carboxamide isomerase [Moraxellaceae bacterium]|jgi:DUF971 family protein|nr:1-(5-phosphoribosyl)-5-((5-phosphoribosylamino)methylideneamino)imidazole-4-carboxamide isomerase [Moraxellaceae bacterium]